MAQSQGARGAVRQLVCHCPALAETRLTGGVLCFSGHRVINIIIIINRYCCACILAMRAWMWGRKWPAYLAWMPASRHSSPLIRPRQLALPQAHAQSWGQSLLVQ
jgi:hypothetical protein